MMSRPPTHCTKYPSSRSRLRSGLRLNGFGDIEDRALFLHLDAAAWTEFAGMRNGRRMAVGHGEHRLGVELAARKGELHHLLECHAPLVDRARPCVDSDFERA